MQALKAQRADVEFIGVGGPRMQAEGLQSYFPLERLAVMGWSKCSAVCRSCWRAVSAGGYADPAAARCVHRH